LTTKIQWTEDTWNPIAGCSVVSPGCTNCYAMRRTAPRLSKNPATPQYHGSVQPSKGGYVWTGKIGIAADTAFLKPLRIKRPTMFFVNSMSDLFHENVPDEVIDRIFAIMALCPQHTFQVLTKRSTRMREYMTSAQAPARLPEIIRDAGYAAGMSSIHVEACADALHYEDKTGEWPLPNVWLGVSVEDQTRADERIPDLLATPAAIRFISAEPLLGTVDLKRWLSISWQCSSCRGYFSGEHQNTCPDCGSVGGWCGSHAFNGRGRPTDTIFPSQSGRGLDWVIVGGESGKGARPLHPDWANQIRDQCASAGVPFFFKQWGEHLGGTASDHGDSVWFEAASKPADSRYLQTKDQFDWFDVNKAPDGPAHIKLGTKAAGRELDGREHNAMPESCR